MPAYLPAAEGDQGPDALDESERPRALQEAIDRREGARGGKTQNEPVAAILERVASHHDGHGKEAEGGQGIHWRHIAQVRKPANTSLRSSVKKLR